MYFVLFIQFEQVLNCYHEYMDPISSVYSIILWLQTILISTTQSERKNSKDITIYVTGFTMEIRIPKSVQYLCQYAKKMDFVSCTMTGHHSNTSPFNFKIPRVI